MDTNVKFTQIDSFDLDTEGLFEHRDNVRLQLYYAYNAFAVLTAVDVAVTTSLLWCSWRKAGMSDKVPDFLSHFLMLCVLTRPQITNLMLYAVVPLYSILSLLLMIFTIVFSPVGIPNFTSFAAFQGANLASHLLLTGFSITILFIVLFMSVKKVWWNLGGVGSCSSIVTLVFSLNNSNQENLRSSSSTGHLSCSTSTPRRPRLLKLDIMLPSPGSRCLTANRRCIQRRALRQCNMYSTLSRSHTSPVLGRILLPLLHQCKQAPACILLPLLHQYKQALARIHHHNQTRERWYLRRKRDSMSHRLDSMVSDKKTMDP
jgi:hypothetical protein